MTGISEPWLRKYINEKYKNVPRKIKTVKKGRIIIKFDEMRSFVGMKANKQWIWLAIDMDSREIAGIFVGSRNRSGAEGLWKSLPPVYRQCAVRYTDFRASYEEVFPKKRHRPVGKDSGGINRIERFNYMLRRRISLLVRKTLSFSKKIENRIGTIWNFIHHYNGSDLGQGHYFLRTTRLFINLDR